MSRFKKIYIEISDVCGLACSFCPSAKNVRKSMPLALFEKACVQSKRLCDRIALHVLGDPCRAKNLSDYLDIAQHYGLKVDLVTSGFYLLSHSFDRLLSPPIAQISISLNAGFDPANPPLENYLETIFEFCRYKLAKDTANFINLRIQDSTMARLSGVKKSILEYFGVKDSGNDSDGSGDGSGDGSKGRFRLGKKVFLNITQTFQWPKISPQSAIKTEKYCHGLISQVAILADGTIVPCCMDAEGKLALGNLYTQALTEVLESPRALRIQEGFMRGEACEELCRHCLYPAKRGS
ncbi:hypothetical protein BKH46_00180 [Helicobacter sp. 12S02634-8]|uniref:radical SAM/SPASM domain-containing protein n=1 Tax=Helicobacter sp. 12S02634-8 TaxID=1476199 RepID=UPI000BD982BF|nr:radical SAM/SPASM domain-containing protein [Helicobacter sp. 12S02634-8]PAF48371.1 hypothetical protein BKH46_00180 [Helicobacter sp. 12S02634-8]